MAPFRLIFVAFFVTLAGLAATACLPVTSKAPVGTTVGLGPDPALAGAWKAAPTADDKGPTYLHFLAGADGGMTVLIVSHAHDKGGSGWSEYRVTAATLNGHHYLNALAVRENGQSPSEAEATRNTPLLYTLSADGKTLSLYLIDEDAAKAAIKAGDLQGTVEPGNFGDVVLTAAPDKLDAFFARDEALRLFGNKPLVVLERLD
jgi:hypothetical protein